MTAKQPLVIIADDDQHLVEALAMRCRQLGLSVEPAFDGRTALAKIDERTPDAVILDVNMPLGDGLAVRRMLNGDPCLAAIPVIILTGRCDADTIRDCHNLMAYYVPKGPGTWSRIEPLLRDLLRLPLQETSPAIGVP